MAYTKSSIELEYVFLGMQFEIEFLEDSFSDEEKKDIEEFVNYMSKEIHIDKSYVDCKENTRNSTFMLESGWNSLRDVILDTKYCKYLPSNAKIVVADAFMTMGRCYIYECLATKTSKFSQVNIKHKANSTFDVVICKDVAHDYRKSIGRWQDWEFDDNGKFLSAHPCYRKKESPEVNTEDD